MLKMTGVLRLGWYVQIVLILSFLWLPFFAGQPLYASQESQPSVRLTTDQAYPFLEKLYHHFHSHPELSFNEKETSARLAEKLKKIGFNVTTQVAGQGALGS